jgi:hypothetical protein
MEYQIDKDIPEDLKELATQILDSLTNLNEIYGNGSHKQRFPSDKRLIDILTSRRVGRGINIIPGSHGDVCTKALVVIVGPKTDIEKRLLEAANHVNHICRGTTKQVVILSFIWNEVIWDEFLGRKYNNPFKGTTCIMILPYLGRVLSLKT